MFYLIIIMVILQWNARSMIANGQEFKRFIEDRSDKPDIICIQETWLKNQLDCIVYGYVSIRRDRVEVGGGCATFIKEGVLYRVLGKGGVGGRRCASDY